MTPAIDSLTLDDLCRDATRLLRQHHLLDTQPDGRVTAAPDPRTIRYYTTLGLLDRPRIVDREARYGWRQVLQLLAIKTLQHDGHGLAAIQQRLYGLTEAELEAILRAIQERKPEPPSTAVLWREITVEPGLKVTVQDGWTPGDPDALISKIRAALAALSSANGGKLS